MTGPKRWHGKRRHGGFRRMGPGRFFDRGEVRLALLALIVEKPRHGYELMQELENRSGGAYRPSAGAIYPTLQLLEDEGFVTSAKEGGKNVYTATDAGTSEAESEQDTVDAIWQRAEEWGAWGPASHPAAMEIARHVETLVKTAFGAVVRKGADPDKVREILDSAATEIDELAGSDERID